ncbi:MAG: hypothetical protein M1826_000600 [Phylliscum demangeonii]|nr:MAG: hypothetical protein M1826_000600 [Phylliscum demangeonii]
MGPERILFFSRLMPARPPDKLAPPYMVASQPNIVWESTQLAKAPEDTEEDAKAYDDGNGPWLAVETRTICIYDPSHEHPYPPPPPPPPLHPQTLPTTGTEPPVALSVEKLSATLVRSEKPRLYQLKVFPNVNMGRVIISELNEQKRRVDWWLPFTAESAEPYWHDSYSRTQRGSSPLGRRKSSRHRASSAATIAAVERIAAAKIAELEATLQRHQRDFLGSIAAEVESRMVTERAALAALRQRPTTEALHEQAAELRTAAVRARADNDHLAAVISAQGGDYALQLKELSTERAKLRTATKRVRQLESRATDKSCEIVPHVFVHA